MQGERHAPGHVRSAPARHRLLGGLLILAVVILATETLARLLPADSIFQALKFLLVIGAVAAAATLGRAPGAAGGALGALYAAYYFPAHVADDPAEGMILGVGLGIFLVLVGAGVGHISSRARSLLTAAAVQREALARAEERAFGIGRLFEHIGEAVVVADAEGRIVLWNPAAERIFGYAQEEAIGMDVARLVPEEYAERHRSGIRRFAETGTGRFIESHDVLRLPALRKDGTRVMVDLTLSSIEDTTRPGRHALAIMRDVTEQVRLNEKLEASNAELRAANETLEAFTYVVAHDLKEPVRALDSFSRALEEDHGAELSPDALDLVQRNRATSERLARLLAGLLDYSRASRILPSDLEPIRVEEALHHPDCVTRFQNVLEERNARLVVTPGPAVQASLAALCQTLGNLVLNSVKHNPGPGAVVRVCSRTWTQDPRMVEVVVEDNGPGFPEAVRERFNRARRGRPQTVRGGFGLIIAREAVEKMGGRMWLDRSAEGGASAHILLPGAAPLDAAPSERPEAASEPARRTRGPS